VARDLKNLAQWAKRFEPAVAKSVNTLVKDTVVDLQTELVRVTPVDTSQALSNWRVELDASSPGTRPAFRVGDRGSTAPYSRARGIAAARGAVRSRKNGQAVWTSNDLEYMGELEAGKSRQAGPGFIQAAIRRVFSRVKGKKLNIKV
jgi:hypothetical protein